mgnify:CR=1 FL=1
MPMETRLLILPALALLTGCATDEWAARQYGAEPAPAQVQTQASAPATRYDPQYGASYQPAPVAPPTVQQGYGVDYTPAPAYQAPAQQPSYGADYSAPPPSSSGGMPPGYVPSVGGGSTPTQSTTPQQSRQDPFIIESE